MLNASGFFGNLLNQYVAKYNSIAERFGSGALSSSSVQEAPKTNLLQPAQSALPAVLPPAADSATLAQPPVSEKPTTSTAQSEPDTFEPQSPQSPRSPQSESDTPEDVTSKPENATYSSSFTNLRYGLKLKFDMQAIERTVRQLSSTTNGDTTTADATLEHLFAGGFGLSSDLKISGVTLNKTVSGVGAELATGAYRQQEALQNARGLQKAAGKTRDSLPAGARPSYQVAVNRFSLRYKTDTQFSFSHFSRFQSQVKQLNDAQPDAVAPYTDTAGQLAQVAPGDVVGQFFDTVDEFLGNKEESLIKNSERFFDMAAQQLGLSEEALKAAKDTVTGAIENFFDSVESSLGTLEESFSQPQALADNGSANQTPVSLDGSNLSQVAQPQAEADQSLLSDLVSALQPDETDTESEAESLNEDANHIGEENESRKSLESSRKS